LSVTLIDDYSAYYCYYYYYYYYYYYHHHHYYYYCYSRLWGPLPDCYRAPHYPSYLLDHHS